METAKLYNLFNNCPQRTSVTWDKLNMIYSKMSSTSFVKELNKLFTSVIFIDYETSNFSFKGLRFAIQIKLIFWKDC